MILNQVYRKIFELWQSAASFCRILHLRMKYPGLTITFNCFVSRNCEIACADDSSIRLDNVHLAPGAIVRAIMGGDLKVKDSYIGFNSVIVAIQSIEIGSNCELAEMVVVRDQDHKFGDGELLSEAGLESAPIIIKNNVWIGAKASILKGTTIEDNAVIGSNAVVTKNVKSNSVFVGVPARQLETKSESLLAKKKVDLD